MVKQASPLILKYKKIALKGYDRGEDPITCRPAEVLEPELEKAKEEIGSLAVDDEDLIVYALFPVTGKKYLMQKYGKEKVPESVKAITLEDVAKQDAMVAKLKKGELIEKAKLEDIPEKSEYARTFNVFVEDECFEVGVDEVGGAPVITYTAPVAAAPVQPVPAAPVAPAPAAPKPAPAAKEEPKEEPAPAASAGTPVSAPMPGMVIKYEKNVGDSVNEGETVVVIEAMKMENALPAPASGVIKAVNYKSGDSVAKGDVLAVIE